MKTKKKKKTLANVGNETHLTLKCTEMCTKNALPNYQARSLKLKTSHY